MEKDLDKKLYNDYLNGEKQAFEFLYDKYKSKITYFIYNIVKDYQKSEDLTQETFIYIMQSKMKEDISFKYYIYLVAKSKAFNYINKEKRRNEIIDEYLSNDDQVEKDVIDLVINKEIKKDLLDSINLLDEKYKNAVYLVNIENLSYQEVAEILGEPLQNTKSLVHRGKKQLKKILLKKGYDNMNKVARTFIMILCITVLVSGMVYAAMKIYDNVKGKAKMTPTFTSKLSTIDTNKVWVGTFNLVWNDFMNDVVGHKIEFEDGYSELAEEFNKQTFTEKELSESSYFKIHGVENLDLKHKIEQGIKDKFNETSKLLDKCDWEKTEGEEGYVLYAMLKKEFNYLEKFSILKDDTFGDSEEKVKYFGLEPSYGQHSSKNIDILFYNSKDDFAIKLKTKEGEEVYLYRTTGEGKSFEENYDEMINKTNKYTGNKNWNENDYLRIPFIQVNDEINYDELCGRYIKGSQWFILQALQTIDFELNNYGGSVKSEALIEATKQAETNKNREFIYNNDFIIFLKEDTKEKPYFVLKVDNTDILVTGDSNNQNEIRENRTETTKITESMQVSNSTENTIATTKKENVVNTSSSNKVKNNEQNSDVKLDNEQQAVLPVIVTEDNKDGIIKFVGIIKNITDECISITPTENERVLGNSILIKNTGNYNLEIDNKVKVSFKGNITKSYPQNIDLISIEKI